MQFRLNVLTFSMYAACVYISVLQMPDSWTKSRQKSIRVFLLTIHSHLCFALGFLFLQTHATCDSFYISVTVNCKIERRKTWLKTITHALWFKKSLQKSQVWEHSRWCPKTFSFSTRNMVIFRYVYLRFEREILGERAYYPLNILAVLLSVNLLSGDCKINRVLCIERRRCKVLLTPTSST